MAIWYSKNILHVLNFYINNRKVSRQKTHHSINQNSTLALTVLTDNFLKIVTGWTGYITGFITSGTSSFPSLTGWAKNHAVSGTVRATDFFSSLTRRTSTVTFSMSS